MLSDWLRRAMLLARKTPHATGGNTIGSSAFVPTLVTEAQCEHHIGIYVANSNNAVFDNNS